MSILQTENLTKIYGDGENAVHALRGINLAVEKGEFTAIVGTSGSGKSTLLHMLGGLDRPTTGKVMVDALRGAAYDLSPPQDRLRFPVVQSGACLKSL